MTDSSHSDEHAILAALEALDDDTGAGLVPTSGGAERAYAELWGMLPMALDPVAPSPELKDRLMDAIAGGTSEPIPFRTPTASPAVPAGRGFASAGWLLPLAAAIAALAVGLSLWLYARVDSQAVEIARLEAELSRTEELAVSLAATSGTLEQQLALVATPGMEVCPLAPMDGAADEARGVVFMDPHQGQWLLRARDLGPVPEGRMYTLWFMGSDGEAMRGGNLKPIPGGSYQLTASGMPEVMTGIAVTLESDEEAPQPTGPTILFGDERFSI